MAGEIQSVLASKKSWTEKKFKAWLGKKKFKAEVESEGEFWIAKQKDPQKYDRVRAKPIGKGIVFRIGFTGAPPKGKDNPGGKSTRPWWDLTPWELAQSWFGEEN